MKKYKNYNKSLMKKKLIIMIIFLNFKIKIKNYKNKSKYIKNKFKNMN